VGQRLRVPERRAIDADFLHEDVLAARVPSQKRKMPAIRRNRELMLFGSAEKVAYRIEFDGAVTGFFIAWGTHAVLLETLI
jgi:hypothetical protein